MWVVQFRSRGEEQAKKIRANADRQREEILAEAYRKSEQIRGEGDATAAKTYAPDESAVHVLEGSEAKLDNIVQTFVDLQGALEEEDSLAVYLIGHGTHDGAE